MRNSELMIVVLTTVPNSKEAEKLAESIIRAKLAACVQVLPEMRSFYFWEDAVQSDQEHLLLIKTLPEKFAELENFIQTNHSYEVPEIIALNAEAVANSYLNWAKNHIN